jgi:flagellar biosynthetic protein FliQ
MTNVKWTRGANWRFVIRHSSFLNMTPEFAIELLKTMIFQALTIAAPVLLTAMVVGLAISLFQAVTTIHEQTLAFVPKALAVIGILLLLLPWIVRSLIDFTTAVILKMPQVAH